MKKLLLIGCSTILLALSLQTVSAQKFSVQEGDAKALSQITKMKVVFKYDEMGVGKFDKEEDYLAKKVKEYNDKEAGKGTSWKKSWIEDRKKRFEPTFIDLFNKHAKNAQLDETSTAPYTMTASTIFTEPGFNIAVMRKNASIDMEFTIMDNSKKVIAKIKMSKAPGRTFGGYDYDTGARIEEAYAMAGKALAKKYFSK